MEPNIHIVTDSSCDLSQSLLDEYQLTIVPLIVRFGGEVYRDGVLKPEAFWEKAASLEHPQTSQPSVGMFQEVFEPLVARGDQVLCVTITGKHSGTFNSARLAAEPFGAAVTVFDSFSLSVGLGLQVLAAAQAARAGRAIPEILPLLEELRARHELMIVLDTLEYLRVGGRADAFMAVAQRMTRALDIKLIVNFVEGRLRPTSAARSFQGGLRRVMDMVERLGAPERLAVMHTRKQQEAEKTADRLAERMGFPRDQIWVAETGAALATHAGPGVIGILSLPRSPGGENQG